MGKVTTGERLAKLETKVDNMHEDIGELKDMIKALDGKFANKWVEKGVIIVVTAIVLFATNSVLGLI